MGFRGEEQLYLYQIPMYSSFHAPQLIYKIPGDFQDLRSPTVKSFALITFLFQLTQQLKIVVLRSTDQSISPSYSLSTTCVFGD